MPGFWITYLYPTNSMGTGGCHEASNGGSGTEGGVAELGGAIGIQVTGLNSFG